MSRKPSGFAVDQVFALARAVQPPGNGDFAEPLGASQRLRFRRFGMKLAGSTGRPVLQTGYVFWRRPATHVRPIYVDAVLGVAAIL